MSESFDPDVVKLSAQRYGDLRRRQAEAGALRMTNIGLLTTTPAGTPVRQHTFYGQHANPARQLTAIRVVLPAATGRIRSGEVHCVMPIQPSPASQTYTVHLRYQTPRGRHVTVIDPKLTLHPEAQALPHVYP
jgi:hypothetical protein